MYPYWDVITEPLLTFLQPRIIVEIGSEQGKSTQQLLAFCETHDAMLHAIDPFPKFDVVAWQARHGDRFVFHAATSLEALPEIDRYDAVLIDGDDLLEGGLDTDSLGGGLGLARKSVV